MTPIPPNDAAPPLRIGPLFAASLRMLAARPVVAPALGVAIVVSLVAVCCGIGAISTPWFLTELFGVQLAAGSSARPQRGTAWLAASSSNFIAVLLVSSAAWLAMLSLGPDMAAPSAAPQSLEWADILRTGAFAGAGSVLALAFIVPFLYTPLILIDRGGRLPGAAIESARLVRERGHLAHLVLSAIAHLIQVAPALAAAIVAARSDDPVAPAISALCAAALMAVTIPLGQGMIVAAYVERRDDVTDPSHTRAAGRPPVTLTATWIGLLLAPAIALVLVGLSLTRPSRVAPGHAPSHELVADLRIESGGRAAVHPPGTALEIATRHGTVMVTASDGGGAGALRLASSAPIERVRVVRVHDVYAVEITSAERAYTTWIDRAGVRLDDHLRARVLDHVELWGLVTILVSLLLTAMLLPIVLGPISEVRRLFATTRREREPARKLLERRTSAIVRAWLAAAVLAPFAVGALLAGIRALL